MFCFVVNIPQISISATNAYLMYILHIDFFSVMLAILVYGFFSNNLIHTFCITLIMPLSVYPQQMLSFSMRYFAVHRIQLTNTCDLDSAACLIWSISDLGSFVGVKLTPIHCNITEFNSTSILENYIKNLFFHCTCQSLL